MIITTITTITTVSKDSQRTILLNEQNMKNALILRMRMRMRMILFWPGFGRVSSNIIMVAENTSSVERAERWSQPTMDR